MDGDVLDFLLELADQAEGQSSDPTAENITEKKVQASGNFQCQYFVSGLRFGVFATC